MDYNLIGFKGSDWKAVLRSSSIIEVTTNIKGTLYSRQQDMIHGIATKAYTFGSVVFSGAASPADTTTPTSINGSTFRVGQILDFYSAAELCFNGYWEASPDLIHHNTYILSITSAHNPVNFTYAVYGKKLNITTMEIDWWQTLASIRATYPSTTHKIIAWAWEGVSTEDLILCNRSYFGDTGRGGFKIIDDNVTTMKDCMLNKMQLTHSLDSEPTAGSKDFLSPKEFFKITYTEDGTPTYDLGDYLSPKAVQVKGYTGILYQEGWYIDFPGTIKIYVAPIDAVTSENIWVAPSSALGDSSPDDATIEVDEGEGGSGSSKESDIGTEENKLSRVGVLGGTNNTGNDNSGGGGFVAFADSIGMTSGQYTLFLAAGGGVVSPSGVFPNGTAYYISDIDIQMSGSSMKVMQISKFDATAILTDGDRIYGYILNEDGDVQPVFAGFVKSHGRTLEDKNQDIVFDCVDLKSYLDQFYTPLIYKHSNWSVKLIAQDLLNQCGIRNQNNLPDDLFIDIDYQGEALTSVLDYLCTISGDFYYWIDRNGDLILDEFRDTTHSFRIPSEGEAIGTNEVLSFNPVTDLSNSRSRIVVTGGSGCKIYETKHSMRFSFYGNTGTQYNSLDEALNYGITGQVLVKSRYATKPDLYFVAKATNAEPLSELYGGEFHTGRALKAIYTQTEKNNPLVTYTQEMTVQTASKVINGVQCAFFIVGAFSVYTIESGYPTIIEVRDHTIEWETSFRSVGNLFNYVVDTGNKGGTLIFNVGDAKFVRGLYYSVDDTWILQFIAQRLVEYYAPAYGGELKLKGLHNEIQIGDRVSLTNTSLPSAEASNLKVKGIRYDMYAQETIITLADRLNISGSGISAEIIRNNKNFYQARLNSFNRSLVRGKLSY